MVLMVGASDITMFPAANRPPPHSVVAQQSHAGYFGYYPQQAAHHHHHHHPHHQYAPPDLNCNLQPFMAGQFGDGLQGGAWHNPAAMYMPASHHSAAAAHCQQRSPTGYEDWVGPLHHNGGHGGASPLPQPSVLSSSAPGGVQQPPHTPSPCAPGTTTQTGPGSPNFAHYQKLAPIAGPPEFSSDGGVPGGGGAQSPHDNVLTLGEGAGEAGSSPNTHGPPPRPQQVRSPFEWMKKPSYQAQPNSDGAYLDMDGIAMKGKTRTKDKYRVVYSDHQRLELEKEFHYSRYITIRRKSELASMLGLSERQVKIWFQNRRAKERKQMKKRDELLQKEKLESVQYHAPTVTPVPPMPPMHAHVSTAQHLPTSKPLMMDVKPVLGLD
ncbi:homeobox protein CHOX-CAD-like [Homarus americanus]|uniref:homeobox protein CHOX-CAD-like n=1 Tax=Homarus americanus TaxID=6706 RepID=UPI001C48EA0A|nr:homeobox protein CHOX-CAD-like [Homarus americanus]